MWSNNIFENVFCRPQRICTTCSMHYTNLIANKCYDCDSHNTRGKTPHGIPRFVQGLRLWGRRIPEYRTAPEGRSVDPNVTSPSVLIRQRVSANPDATRRRTEWGFFVEDVELFGKRLQRCLRSKGQIENEAKCEGGWCSVERLHVCRLKVSSSQKYFVGIRNLFIIIPNVQN